MHGELLKVRCTHCVELNLEPSAVAELFHEHHYGPATKVVPAFVKGLLKEKH